MVSTASIIFICITLCVTLILPIVLVAAYCIKNKSHRVWTAALLGAAGFVVPQMLIRLPMLSVLSLFEGYLDFAEHHYLLYVLILGMTAALFELAGRFTVAKILTRKQVTFRKGLAAGLGHGCIESVLIIGLTYVNNLLYAVMINTGIFDRMTEGSAAMGVDTMQLEYLRDTMLNTEPSLFLLAGYERILTVILHAAMSLIVCYFVAKRMDAKGAAICFLLHTLVDTVTPLVMGLATENFGNILSEGTAYTIAYAFLTVFAAAGVVVILKLKSNMTEEIHETA